MGTKTRGEYLNISIIQLNNLLDKNWGVQCDTKIVTTCQVLKLFLQKIDGTLWCENLPISVQTITTRGGKKGKYYINIFQTPDVFIPILSGNTTIIT